MSLHFGLSEKTTAFIRLVFSRHPEIEQALLFGSRAKGTAKPGSDIDLALAGEKLTETTLNQVYQELDDLPIPYEFSLVLQNQQTDGELLAHIGRVGLLFYEKGAAVNEPR